MDRIKIYCPVKGDLCDGSSGCSRYPGLLEIALMLDGHDVHKVESRAIKAAKDNGLKRVATVYRKIPFVADHCNDLKKDD